MKILRSVPVLFAALVAAALLPASASAAVAHGLIDQRLVNAGTTARNALLTEDHARLHATFTRVLVDWSQAEPTQGHFNQAYLNAQKAICTAAKAHGFTVIVTIVYAPSWAVNTSLLTTPPPGYTPGVAYKFDAIDTTHLAAFGTFVRTVVHQFGHAVFGYECWNEPNLWSYIYPQRTTGDSAFAAHLYAKMLHQFYMSAKAERPAAVVIGGVTGPVGLNDVLRTSPQRFAQVLKAAGAAAWMNAYSHHPYTPGGSVNPAPEAKPHNPSTTVTLGNLSVLLKLFPTKPFYLTEYGYNTQPSVAFGTFTVSKSAQAAYLQRAYRFAARYSQVKALFWYLAKDVKPSDSRPAKYGVYTGLRGTNNLRKPAWFAFAGHNRLTAFMGTKAHLGHLFLISGGLSCWGIGVPSQELRVEFKSFGHPWTVVTETPTHSGGAYLVSVHPKKSGYWRVEFAGVVAGAPHWVRVVK
jgi:hypothetical protein